ncbi:MAG: glycosyltransferase [Anaerolineaceae bacterium]|nr:glycosyltransferase [Anaerolineaceae bacterium]
MHILMLTPSLPYPPQQGGAIRNYGIIKGLHAAGHYITLLSFHDRNGLQANVTPLTKYCTRIETVPPPTRTLVNRLRDLIFSGQPDLARRLHSPQFADCLRHLLAENRYDLVQFEGLEMAAYLPLVRHSQPEARLIYDAHNAEYALQKAIFQVDRGTIYRWLAAGYSLVQSQRITRFEGYICQHADQVIAVSDEDAAALGMFRSDGDIGIVPNGIHISDYVPTAERLDLGKHALVFTGKMDYRPNVDAMDWFAEAILPLVLAQIPDTRLYIVGQKPHARLEKLREKPYIEITGWVQDIQPFLYATTVYIAPLRMGSGTRLKILEAMAAGQAIVATVTAASGLNAPTDTIIIADNAEDMAGAIVALLQDTERREQIGERAHEYVKQHYDWSVLIPRLLAIYKGLGLG